MKPLVLGLAYGYKWISVAVFLKSLRASGFTGDLALFVDARDRSLRRQVERHGGIAILVGAKYPYNDSLDDGDGDGAFFDGASPHVWRYKLYQMYLRASDERHDRVMLTDVKDVLFQRDPFAFDNGGAALCVFEEDRSLRIADCPLNATWLVRAFGEVALGHVADRPILCSGTTSGRIEGIAAYCDAMVETLRGRGVTWIGGDQGVHNFLVYTGRFGTARAFLNEDGPVLTLASRREVLKCNPSGFLVNRAGEVPNVLHQYDRSPALLRWAGARYMTFSQRLWVELAMAKKTLAARN